MAKRPTQNSTAEAPSAQVAEKATRIRKITTAVLWTKGGVKSRARQLIKEANEQKVMPETKEFLVMRIIGRVFSSNIVEGPFGESMRLIGNFHVTSGKDGKTYASSTCFLPGFMERDVVAAYNEHGGGTEFGYDVTARPREPIEGDANDQPFEYVSYPLFEQVDALADTMKKLPPLPGEFLALSAPVVSSLPAPGTASEEERERAAIALIG